MTSTNGSASFPQPNSSSISTSITSISSNNDTYRNDVSTATTNRTSRIVPLPQTVINRISAGEVIQRPSSAIKELLENSLDAQSSIVEISASRGGMHTLSVRDDGCGIHPSDLTLAVTRFATSKLKAVDDLKSISTFGFRGEALASVSMVGRLTITSKRRWKNEKEEQQQTSNNKTSYSKACAYKLSYIDGKPTRPQATPSAGKEGTLIQVSDLFYNLPSRKRSLEGSRKEAEEYHKILNICQKYAIHMAGQGVGVVCRNKGRGGAGIDLNTGSLSSVKPLMDLRKRNNAQVVHVDSTTDEQKEARETATKDVIGHIYGVHTSRELLDFHCQEGSVQEVSLAALKAMQDETEPSPKDATPSISHVVHAMDLIGQTDLVKDISLSDTCADMGSTLAQTSSASNQCASFAVEVHGMITNASYNPPKSSQTFVLFINDRLVESPCLKKAVESAYIDVLPRGTKPFCYLSLTLPGPHVDVNIHPTKREVAILHEEELCRLLAHTTRDLLWSTASSRTFYTQAAVPKAAIKTKREGITEEGANRKRVDKRKSELMSDMEVQNEKKESDVPVPKPKNGKKNEAGGSSRKAYDPKNLVRSNSAAQPGALEPFLVTAAQTPGSQTKLKGKNTRKPWFQALVHEEGCEFANKSTTIDMSVPGAFASICRCQVVRANELPPLSASPQQPIILRPKSVPPTECQYASIQTLRANILSRAHSDLTSKLRDSIFVGCISPNRSLIQSGIELIMLNHVELSRELYYQLALNGFGGFQAAKVGELNVKTLIEQAFHLKESTSTSSLDDTNNSLSEANKALVEEATQTLNENAEMLKSYFSICFEKKESEVLVLKELPILLEGHTPSPQGLPSFLLRLANEVNMKDEYLCFEGVCSEIGVFYGDIPAELLGHQGDVIALTNDRLQKFARHTVFPGLKYLLTPPEKFSSDGSFCILTKLSALYKVFERC